MATKKKTPDKKSAWTKVSPAMGPDQYVMGAYTVTDGNPKAVIFDGRVIGYGSTLEAARDLAERHAGMIKEG